MQSLMKCRRCDTYTMKTICPKCGNVSSPSTPPRFSSDDKYGEYRRKTIKEAYGENGKLDKIS